MEHELDTQELEYSADLDSSSESEENHDTSLENVLAEQKLTYSVHLSSSDEVNSSIEIDSDESLPDLSPLKPYDFESVIKVVEVILFPEEH